MRDGTGSGIGCDCGGVLGRGGELGGGRSSLRESSLALTADGGTELSAGCSWGKGGADAGSTIEGIGNSL